MSIKVMSLIWDSNLPSGQKMVLLAIADHANDEGVAWPSVGKLHRKCSMVERTVQTHIKWLRDEEWMAVKERRGHSNLYQVNLRKFCTPADSAPRKNCAPASADSAPPPPQNPHPESSVESSVESSKKARALFDQFESWLIRRPEAHPFLDTKKSTRAERTTFIDKCWGIFAQNNYSNTGALAVIAALRTMGGDE